MPELSALTRAGLPQIQFQPINPSSYIQEPPAPLPADTQQASAALGHAAVLGAISKSIAELPETFEKAYAVSQKRGITNRENTAKLAGLQLQSDILSGGLSDDKKKALAGATIGPDGSMQFKIEDPRKSEAELEALKLRGSQNGQSQGIKDFRRLEQEWNLPASGGDAPGDGATREGSVFGRVPDGRGGDKMDPNDITDAGVPGFSATKGAWGHNIQDPTLRGVALTPSDLRAAGIDPNDPKQVAGHVAEVTGPDGRVHKFEIVDKLGKEGRADLTLAAYREMGGPEERNGGAISGMKVRVVPKEPAPTVTGAVDPGTRQQILDNSERAAQGLGMVNLDSVLSAENKAGPIPAANGALSNIEIRRATRGRIPGPNGTTAAFIESPTPDVMIATTPGGYKVPIAPKVKKDEEGMAFASPEAARLAGFDPTGATVLPDGTIRVTSFKPSGTDAKGKAKITDNQKNALGSAAVLAKTIDDSLAQYDTLAKEGKTGPVSGTIEGVKQRFNMGDEEFSRENAKIQTSLFKIARMLNGAGVLTEKDVSRAEAVAPTLKMSRGQFKGQLDAVKSTIKDALETWMQTNAGQATDEQIELAKTAIASLTGGTPAAAAATAPVPAIPSARVKMRAPDGTEQWVKPEAVEKYKARGATIVP